ncbi:P pilus assembly protein, chaperone PapD [Nostoc sp. PCC 7524]|uniref:fimbrial biogenesis chaperone n=1 Tax=Nostoc sp. (strain ATCC 29411 / PCC 7524) TaxID=28072 RepID=UPI00029EF4C8|nr:fimbria/pilus periplasmic chaperone [Nostoc sp. PCC 7524]AFY49871.1 P pilus assembly protein, chaperone PapD [Nostoc sp. PCC 7524]
MLPKFRNLTLGLIGALALGLQPAEALNIGVTPPKFHVDISSNKTRSQAIKVMNFDSKPVEFRVYVQSWNMNEQNKIQVLPPEEQSLEQWIVFTPSRFTIPPGGVQTIRFAVRPRVQPQSGEHRAVIFIEEVPRNNTAQGIRLVGKLGVAVYGYVGDIQRVGVLNAVNVNTKPNALNAVFDISSQGNGYVNMQGQYTIWPADKYPGTEATKPIGNLGKPETKIPEPLVDAGLLPSTPVLPNSRRNVLLPIKKDLPPGKYVLDIKGDLNGVAIKKGIPFTVPVNRPVATNRSRIQPSSQKLRDSLRNSQPRK